MPNLTRQQQRILAIAARNRGRRSGMNVTAADLLVELRGYERKESGAIKRKPEAPEQYENDLDCARRAIAELVKIDMLTRGIANAADQDGACLTGPGLSAVDSLLAKLPVKGRP